jgi:acyl-CoA synthetase (AMP-forming)/AMP-acid ligase II/kynurenine formamidase
MRHLRTLADAVERHHDRPLLIDAQNDGAVLTYGEAHALAANAGAELRRRGLGRGDRLGVALPNSVDLALLYLGALYAGVVVVPLGAGFGRRELRSILERAQPAQVVTGPSPDPALVDAAQAAGVALTQLDPRAAAPPGDGWRPLDGVASRDVVAIHFTSGTTGTPRGVGHRLSDFVANAQRYAAATGLGADNRLHHNLPMTYMAGYYNLLLLPFTLGASVVIDRAFDARSLLGFFKTVGEHGADVLWLVPTIMAMLLKIDRGDEGRALIAGQIKMVVCGTAPLSPQLRTRFEERYGTTVHDSYGLSETLLAAVSTPARPAAAGTVGTLLDGVEMMVRPVDGAQDGELLIRSPDTMAGYLEEGTTFADPGEDGWLPTGDLGTIGPDGEVRISGRSKEIVIRGGVNVSPVAVEGVLAAEEAVERVAVVGVPDALLGEQLVAVVQMRDGATLQEAEPALKARAAQALPSSQHPGVYLQIDELPRTPTGKVRKAAVRDMVIDQLGLPAAGKGFTVDEATTAASAGAGRLVDLSHPLHEGMLTFPGLNHPRTEVTQLARHGVEGRATRRLVLGTHTGTHLDAPLHFVEGGGSIDQVPLSTLVGPATVADLGPAGPLEEVSLARLQAAVGGSLRHPRVLLRFGWSARFGRMDFYTESPFLARDACAWLVEQGAALVGMDVPSPDDPRLGYGSEQDSPNHHILLGAGVILLEYLNNLEQLSAPEVFLAALPLRVRGADGAPARVIAIEGDGAPG